MKIEDVRTNEAEVELWLEYIHDFGSAVRDRLLHLGVLSSRKLLSQ